MLQNGKFMFSSSFITIDYNQLNYIYINNCRFQDTMVAVIGQRKTEISLTTGKLYTTDEALNIGLIDESVPDVDTALTQGNQFLNNFQRISRE